MRSRPSLQAVAPVLGFGVVSFPLAAATAETCARDDFRAVVEETASLLESQKARNAPAFQARLRQLRFKHGWDDASFLSHAKPYVRDPRIDGFDTQIDSLMQEIAKLGNSGSTASRPDCAMLAALRRNMEALVSTQKAKWSYMFEKIDKALGEN